ncbi:MAG: putative manganese transporter, partial [Candidatus Pacebacteria bacterium]|nr:putative manganese transporter [Candidatus Paceibacterota bacterium]
FIHLISLGVGIATGYVVDAFGVGPKLAKIEKTAMQTALPCQESRWPHIGHVPGDALSSALHPANREVMGTLGYEITHRGYVLYWLITVLGVVLGGILLFQQDISKWIGFDLNRIVGLTGTAISVIWLIAGRHGLADDTHAELEEKTASLKQMFIHNAHETAFVTFWVFVAYALYSLFMHFTQLDLAAMVTQAGILPVFITACIGLVPGCGPQIVVVTLYTKGVIPFSAVVAHTLSQDGDALFPILAMNPRAAVWLTVTTTVPAVVIGVLFYVIGM